MLFGLIFCLLSAFLITLILLEIPDIIGSASSFSSLSLYPSTPSHAAPPFSHPIPQLIREAEVKFERFLAKQSTTLDRAIAEYRRRYNRAPPKGFDEWFAFAEANNVTVIDEYDGMMKELEPFWELSGEEIRRRVSQVGQLPSIDLVRLQNGTTVTLNVTKKFNDTEGNARAKGFRVMIEKFQKKLPDMDFPINAKAEARVLVPWEHREYPSLAPRNSSGGVESMLGSQFTPDWKGDSNVWESFRRTCHPSSQARRLFGSVRGSIAMNNAYAQRPYSYLSSTDPEQTDNGAEFNFVQGVDDNYDYCTNPWARYNQGHFFSDWRTIPVLYPVFSPAKAPGYSDILIPSHYYYSSTKKYTYGWDPEKKIINDIDPYEIEWENKTNRIFWRGATTGGGSSPPGFLTSYQRHRLIEMTGSTNNATKTVLFPHPETKEIVSAEVPLSELNEDFMDISFTKAVGCDAFPGGCKAMKDHYRFSQPVPMGDIYQHKYLVDVDGMGYSARSMALLTSYSTLIKASVYREFFTDWIQPWLHFVPLSQSYKEIYNIHAFFSGPSPAMLRAANITVNETLGVSPAYEEGDKLLKKIAMEGRRWKRTVGRKIDMEAYVYRLCLEYARLWSDDRESMSYSETKEVILSSSSGTSEITSSTQTPSSSRFRASSALSSPN